jgi:hypothetical protein
MARPKKQVDKTKVNRKVSFYRINAGVAETGQPRTVNFGPALRSIEAMAFNEAGRYLSSKTDMGKDLCCWIEPNPQLPYKLKLGNIRRSDHPPVEQDGKLSPLLLGAKEGLAELTHFVIFADGIVGVESNYFGPRASAFPFYCALKVGDQLPSFKLNPLLRRDIQKQIAELGEVRMLDMKIKTSYAEVVEQANSDLGSAFRATAKAVGARPSDDLELYFRRSKAKEQPGGFLNPVNLIPFIQSMARRKDLREEVSTFRLQGEGRRQVVDVLSEQFVMNVSVERSVDRSNAVNSESVYEAITAAHADLLPQLNTAEEVELS